MLLMTCACQSVVSQRGLEVGSHILTSLARRDGHGTFFKPTFLYSFVRRKNLSLTHTSLTLLLSFNLLFSLLLLLVTARRQTGCREEDEDVVVPRVLNPMRDASRKEAGSKEHLELRRRCQVHAPLADVGISLYVHLSHFSPSPPPSLVEGRGREAET